VTTTEDFIAASAGRARWPTPPENWSYSSLREAEECPRRWSLSRASYPAVWDQSGYPQRPVVAALVGEVVHSALERVLRALDAEGCDSRSDTGAVSVLRNLGGYSALVRDAIEEQLRRLELNPRMAPRIESLRAVLNQRVPDIRQRVQSIVTRMPLGPSGPRPEGETGGGRGPLGPGSYPEIELRAPRLRFFGRVDLLSVDTDHVTITDYKTGQPDQHHADQLRIYALLWYHDEDLNPTGVPAASLSIVYAAHDEHLDAPDAVELDDLATTLDDRIEVAESQLRLRPPPARPAPDVCRYCSVRHMCEDYWAGVGPPAVGDAGTDPVFVDCEGTITGRNGPRSWMLSLDPTRFEVLLRTPTETPGFEAGDRIRMLGVVYGTDDDAERTVATITQASEVFVLTE
jgi:hypothetical protein